MLVFLRDYLLNLALPLPLEDRVLPTDLLK